MHQMPIKPTLKGWLNVKIRIASLSLLALYLTLAAAPAMAQVVYSNGPSTFNADGWGVNFGYITSDTFNTNSPNTSITGITFTAWLFPGDTLTSAEISITSSENGGTSYFNQTVNFTGTFLGDNGYGYEIFNETGAVDVNLVAQGTYWLNIQNASVPSGDPVFWDENSGPSSASFNSVGTIPSEAFTVLGTSSSTTTSTSTTTGTVPEPSSIMLFGSGILGLASVLRRKLF
jgi:hypothetical protein